jgi:hypothetical protein
MRRGETHRAHQTYGEDPYLVTALGVAFTRGMQGKDLREGVLASAKHFIGYAVTEAGQNMAATAVGPRELYDVYARPSSYTPLWRGALTVRTIRATHGRLRLDSAGATQFKTTAAVQ